MPSVEQKWCLYYPIIVQICQRENIIILFPQYALSGNSFLLFVL